jgi:hypothetical protein
MTRTTSVDRTTRRIAGACSLIAGTPAVYWLIQMLRNQVPDSGVTDVEINIVMWSIVALSFGVVAKRREPSDRSTNAPFVFTLLSAGWALRFVFKLNSRQTPAFGPVGILTLAITVGLVGAAILVKVRLGRSAAQPGVEPDGPSARGLTP